MPARKPPPCAPGIAKAGVARVVIAAPDPTHKVHGIKQLKKAGIKVQVGLLQKEAAELIAPFAKYSLTGKPFVHVKVAQNSQGIIGARGKSLVWLSGKKFGHYSHQLRNRYDGILVGINTVLADNPRLTCRIAGGRNPARIILDSSLRIPLSAKVLRRARKEKVIAATSERRDREKEKALLKMGVKVLVLGKNKVDLQKLLPQLPKLGVHSLLVEGGAGVIGGFLRLRLADRLTVAVSMKKLAKKGAIYSPVKNHLLLRLAKTKMGADTVYEGPVS